MRVILQSGSPRHLACLVLSVFSIAVAMDGAKVSSMIANSNKELIYQFKALISDSIWDLKRANEATA